MSLSDCARKYVNGGRPLIYTAQQLMERKSSRPTILVPGLISQGLTLLAGKPKLGKSLLSLGLALGVARGGEVLGREVEAQEVLYLALETTNEQMQERLTKMLQEDPLPQGLYLGYSGWAKEGAELEELEQWLRDYPAIRLVIIDILAKFGSWKQGNYNSDYQEMAKFKALADRSGISLILVHHERKNGARNRFDRVSGSTGLTGAVDTLITLERQLPQKEGTLFISGRDLPDTEIPMILNSLTGSWEVRKPGQVNNLTPERQEVVDLLKTASGPLGLQDIAMALGKKKANVANLLKKLVDRGPVEKVRYGKYQLKSRAEHDQGGSSFRSAPSLMPKIAPCESQPASPIPESETTGEDTDLHSAYPVNESMNQEKIKAGLLTGLASLDQKSRNIILLKETAGEIHDGKPVHMEEPRQKKISELHAVRDILATLKQELAEWNEDASPSKKRKKNARIFHLILKVNKALQEERRWQKMLDKIQRNC